MADWNAIKTEYITTNTSYRKLAQKYGVHYNLIHNRSKQEGWIKQREQYRDKTVTNTINVISENETERTARLIAVSDTLLGKVETLLQDAEILLMPQSLKSLSSVLKDIKDIQMIKSDADIREQEARIANLKRQAEQEDSNDVTITFVGGDPSWRE